MFFLLRVTGGVQPEARCAWKHSDESSEQLDHEKLAQTAVAEQPSAQEQFDRKRRSASLLWGSTSRFSSGK
jgi:hypothetical protein